MTPELHPDIAAHYDQDVEYDRLATWGRLEALRTNELLERFLPPAPATVLDVGGASGAYALPLAARGYAVHLLDAHAPHIEAATAAARDQPDAPLASAAVGDARSLPYTDGVADAVLLLGPLYHLVDASDRRRALAEAARVLAPGGRLMAAGISRFASTLDGLRSRALRDPAFERVVEGDLRDGVHRNPDPVGRPEWFTLAYFHRPDELTAEVADAGFADVDVLAIEGVGAVADVDLDDEHAREMVLRAIRRTEAEPALLGMSNHLMAIARKG